MQRDPRLARVSPEVGLLAALSVQLNEATSPAALFERIHPLLAESASTAYMLIWHAREDRLELLSAAGNLPPELMEISRSISQSESGFGKQALHSRQAIFVGSYGDQAGAHRGVASHFAGACAFLPLLDREGKSWGVLALASSEARQEWPEATQLVLEIAGRMIATALILQLEVEERQRHEAQLQQNELVLEERVADRTREVLQLKTIAERRATEAEYLVQLSRELDRHDDPRVVMTCVAQRLQQLFQPIYVTIRVGDLENGLEPWATAGPLPPDIEFMRHSPYTLEKGGKIWKALANRKAIYVDDYRLLPKTAEKNAAMGAAGLTTCAHVPVPVDDTRVGVLSVLKFGEPSPWTLPQKQLLEASVHTLSLALQRAARMNALQQERDYADVLRRVSELTDSDRPLEEVAGEVVGAISRIMDVDWAGFATVEGDIVRSRPVWGADNVTPELNAALQSGSARGDGVIWSAIERAEAIFVDDYTALCGGIPTYADQGVRSAAYVPVLTVGVSSTVFTALRLRQRRPWSARDRNLFLAAARSIGLAAARRRSLQQLRSEADLDALTGLHNRGYFDRALAALQENDALVLLDLDHFKRVNDQQGHRAGDRELKAFADCLRKISRQNDLVARYGGEEFVVILPGSGVQGGHGFLERLKAAWRGLNRSTTFSAGIAGFKGSPALTFERADSALYRAKERGRNRYEVAEDRPFSRSVLLVEDHRDVRLATTELLEAYDYEVVAVPDGLSALTVLRARAGFDVIMLDLMMPVMNGRQLAAELKLDPVLARIPVIVFSASADIDSQAAAAGAAAWLQKPFSTEELENVLKRVIGAGKAG